MSGSGQEGIAAAAAAGAATVAAATAAQADRTPEAVGTADESAAAVQAETVAQAETAADMAADAGSAAAIAAGAAAAVPEEKGTPAGQILQDSGAEDLSDLNDEQMEGMESALETALAKAEEADKTDHSASVPPEAQGASYESLEDAPDEIELAIPVRTLEEVLQEAYSNGDDPHIRKDPTTGITMVDFSESFAGGKTEDWD